MHNIIEWDKSLFYLVNSKWHNPVMDWLMPLLRNSPMWNPFYLFLILLIVTNFKKNIWWYIGLAALTVIISNYISSNLIKENIYRLRPCNDPSIASWVRVLVGYRPQSSSFTSSHAANHFAIAVYLYITLKPYFAKWVPVLFLIWAAAISYSQVYVGVHYPLDIAGGTIIGILIGYLCGKSFNKQFGLE